MKRAGICVQWSIAFIVLLMLFCLAATVEARDITDMFGRRFSLSGHPRKVFSASPPDTWLRPPFPLWRGHPLIHGL